MSTPTPFYEVYIVHDHSVQDGYAVLKFEWGTYEGYFSGGKANGFGVQSVRRRLFPGALPSEEVTVYRGDWRDGKREGYGRLEIADSNVYEGGWVDGKVFGYGKTFTMVKGWAGEWEECGFKNGYRHGWGVMCVTNDPTETVWWTGGFKEGQRHGYSLKTSGGIEKYSSLKYGVPHGYETCRKESILISREFFLDGQRRPPPTSPIPAQWFPSSIFFNHKAARYVGRTHTVNGSAIFSNGDQYNGNLSYGVAHGYGVFQLSFSHRINGTYDGGFKHGYASGYGVWMGTDGFVYAGGWLNGKPFGYGKLTSVGSTFDTFWEEGNGWKFDQAWASLDQPAGIFRTPSPAPLPTAWTL
jgi:hypothetical protein